ncbi:tetratricopeptide repeat protein [Marinibaculum pumilum]|uniref:protein O-GlcNAc transferase n=1 Tax=Marinibaculum pumilum TaxID=1766165 RepID=A0ABV7KY16_9PROT
MSTAAPDIQEAGGEEAGADFAARRLDDGVRLAAAGRIDDAVACFAAAAQAVPADPRALLNAGSLLLDQGRAAEALPWLERALSAAPADPRALCSLGTTEVRLGRTAAGFGHLHAGWQAAEARAAQAGDDTAAREAVRPMQMLASANLALALMAVGDHAAACPLLERTAGLAPERAEPWYLLALARQRIWDLDGAERAARRALQVEADNPRALANLASILKDLGRPAEAVDLAWQALRNRQWDSSLWSNLIFLLDFDSRQDTASQQAVRRHWALRFGGPRNLPAAPAPAVADPGAPAPAAPDPERRLTIGYVSPDFRRHSAARAFAPLILGRDRSRLAAVCYMTSPATDDLTARFRDAADLWRDATTMSDGSLEAQIRADGIDILVDCCGHTDGHRLEVFARRPAPVQVSAWGHPTGTGLAAIDWLFTDPVVVPPQEDALFVERPYRMESVALLRPMLDPPVAPPPFRTRGAISFGAFARAPKLTDDSLRLWAAVLQALPDSRLVLKDFGFTRPAGRAAFCRRAAALGLPAERLTFLPGTAVEAHLNAFAEIDIALDTLPVTGGVGTGDALWMGVPVVTLRGRAPAGRVSASVLTQIGLEDCVAEDAEGYVAAALRLAQAPERLDALRQRLRPALAAAPAGDRDGHVRRVEAAFRDIWRRHCAGLPGG